MSSDRWRQHSRWILGVVVCIGIMVFHPSIPTPGHVTDVAVASEPTSEPTSAPTFAPTSAPSMSSERITAQLNQGKAQYDLGNLSEAKRSLEIGLQIARSHSDILSEAIIQSNLALVEGQMGHWEAATDAIALSQTLLKASEQSTSVQSQSVLAQALNIKGRLQLAQGQSTKAFKTWQQAESHYRQANDNNGVIQAQLRQVRALQSLGFYQRAVTEILYPLYQQIKTSREISPMTKIIALNNWAETFQMLEGGHFAKALEDDNREHGSEALPLPTAKQAAEDSLAIAEALDDDNAIAIAQLTLGNIAFAKVRAALEKDPVIKLEAQFSSAEDQPDYWYQKVSNAQASPANQMRGQLNQLNFWVTIAQAYEKQDQLESADEAFSKAVNAWNTIQPKLADLEYFPTNQSGIFARINLAQHGLSLTQSQRPGAPTWENIQQILAQATTEAQATKNKRLLSHTLGTLGHLAQAQGNIEAATAYTEQALLLSTTVNAADITYRYYEQLGKLAETANNSEAAIHAYKGAVGALTHLRTDLTTINPELLFSFEKSVEPIHRKLLALLLKSEAPTPDELKQTRSVIESLQVEELNNYFKAACVRNNALATIDSQTNAKISELQVSENTAIIYPVILEDRLATIVDFRLTKGHQHKENEDNQLYYYQQKITSPELQKLTERIVNHTQDLDKTVIEDYQQLYKYLFPEALETQLKDKQIKMLVFVPDSFLRNVSMSALHNGERYLVEDYPIAIVPNLQLFDFEPLQNKSVIAFGLTKGFPDRQPSYSALPNVDDEIASIKESIPSTQSFLNKAFTLEKVEKSLRKSSKSIVHLATHGKFDTSADDTFILTGEGEKITLDDLSQWLRAGREQANPIELLVLSACETATSDKNGRAALGLAGVTVRSGAKSTIASLWQADDNTSSVIMQKFYQELEQGTSKAKALQRAQISLINGCPAGMKGGCFLTNQPYFWSGFVLVGNWL